MRTVFGHQAGPRWRDAGALGHASHAVFLTCLEEGRDACCVQALGRDPRYVAARAGTGLRAGVGYAGRRLRVRTGPSGRVPPA